MLPNQVAPLLIFMGAEADGGNAELPRRLDADDRRRGQLPAEPDNCAFVDIGPGAEHDFTTEEGESYALRVEEIRRVKVEASREPSRGPSAHASVGVDAARAAASVPSLIDLVEVSTTTHTTTADRERPIGRQR